MTDTAIAPRRARDRLYVALDTPDVARASALSRALAGAVGGVKLGLEFFAAAGPEGVRRVTRAGPEETPRGEAPVQQRLFLDLKFHDIPNTVAGAVRSSLALGPAILNVHAAGGAAMMRAARETADFEADSLGVVRPMLIAVTVLTSLDDDDLAAVGQGGPAVDQAVRLARLAQDSGLDGVVCSAREIEAIRAACGPDFRLVVPGLRPAGSAAGDQKRTWTPRAALAAGADFLVVGRPITGAADPAAAAADMAAELDGTAG